MDVVTAAKVWMAVRPIRRIKEARQARLAAKRAAKELTSEGIEYEVTEDYRMRGKLTYTGIAVLALSWVMERFGVPVAPEEAEGIVAAGAALVGALAAIYGRYRATKAAR